MLGLFYADFLIRKKEVLLNALVIAGYSVLLFLPWGSILEQNGMLTDLIRGETVTFGILPFFVYVLVFIILSGLQSSLFSGEQRNYHAFVASTPLTAKGYILSKYYEVLLLSFAGVLWGAVCDLISSLCAGSPGSAMPVYLSLFFIQILLRAVDLPFLICFGLKYGNTVKQIVLSVAAAAAIVYALFGRLPDIGSDVLFQSFFLWFVSEEKWAAFPLGLAAVFPYVAVGMFYVSYRLSVKLYLGEDRV